MLGCPITEDDPYTSSGLCAINNGGCGDNAICSQYEDFTSCECASGYIDNGTMCVPVSSSACSINNGGCDPNAICTEDAHFTYCECAPGYDGDGTICTPESTSACAVDNGGCDFNAICTEDADFTYCECASGYVGSGFICEPATFPQSAYSFIDDTTLDVLEAEEMPIHYGSTPPDITGLYFLDSLMDWVYESDPYPNYFVNFSDQTTDGFISVCTYSEDSTDSACSVAAYVSGWGNECFTVFANSAGRADACEYDATSVYSGCIDTNGDIVNYFEAFYDRNQVGMCDGWDPVGEITILYEDDAVAEWMPSN